MAKISRVMKSRNISVRVIGTEFLAGIKVRSCVAQGNVVGYVLTNLEEETRTIAYLTHTPPYL